MRPCQKIFPACIFLSAWWHLLPPGAASASNANSHVRLERAHLPGPVTGFAHVAPRTLHGVPRASAVEAQGLQTQRRKNKEFALQIIQDVLARPRDPLGQSLLGQVASFCFDAGQVRSVLSCATARIKQESLNSESSEGREGPVPRRSPKQVLCIFFLQDQVTR